MRTVVAVLVLLSVLLVGFASAQQLTSLTFLGLNTGRVPENVRKAIAFWIDRDTLFDSSTGFTPAYWIQPPGMVGHNPRIRAYPLDRSKGSEIMAGAKFEGELWFVDTQGRGAIARSLAASLSGLGVTLRLAPFRQVGDMVARLDRGEATLFMLTWVPNRDAPFVRNIVSGESAVSRYGYRNEAYQQGLRQAAAETDSAKSTEIYQKLEEMILMDAVVIPLYYSRPQ